MSNHTTTFKAFPYAGQFYVYDANTNQLLRITKDIYLEICTLQKCGVADYRKQQRTTPAYIDTITLLNKGLFFTSFLKEIEHPDTNYLPEMIDRCINQLILGVTSACNFNCRYCHQATGKLLSKKSIMDKETAYRSVDFLYTHSKDAFDITITFYGGEPLLNFDLIKATVHYASNKFYTKSVSYNITTNASLMNAEIIHFFVSNNFKLLISLDGGKETQDRHRRYQKDGNPTFDSVWENILFLKNTYPEYFYSNVSFNAVILQDETPENVFNFFSENDIPAEKVTVRNADMDGIDYYPSTILLTQNAAANKLEKDLYQSALERFTDKCSLPANWHPNGPCVPAVRRLFVNADGEFYPCEKIDSDSSCLLGTLSSGINLNKAHEILNISKLTEQACKECWAIRFCTMCAHNCIDNGFLSASKKTQHCKLQRNSAMQFLKKYIANQSTEGV